MGFKLDWALVGKTGVETGAVIKGFDVVEDGGTRFGEGGEALVINDFVFEAAPEGFDEGVIVAIGLAAAMTRRASRIWCMAQPMTRRVQTSRTATR